MIRTFPRSGTSEFASTTDNGRIRTLSIPTDRRTPCAVRVVPLTAAALSDAIDGGQLDDAYYGVVGDGGLAGQAFPVPEGGYCLYLDENRAQHRLPPNERCLVLGARLGWDPRHRLALLGDVLVVGATAGGNDADVPTGVLTAAWRGGLIPALLAEQLRGARGHGCPGRHPAVRAPAQPVATSPHLVAAQDRPVLTETPAGPR